MNELISKLQKMHEEWMKASQLAMAATHDEQKAKCIAADKFSVQLMEMIPEIVDALENSESPYISMVQNGKNNMMIGELFIGDDSGMGWPAS